MRLSRSSAGPRHLALALTLCAWADLVTPQLAWSAEESLVRCESAARETSRCAADTRGGVMLQRQLSRAGCWYDETWGYDSKGIWVSNGCRADFALGSKPSVGDSASPPTSSQGTGLTGNQIAAGAAAALVVGAIAAAVIAGRGDDDDDDDDDRRCRYRDSRGRCRDGENDPWDRDKLVRCESQGQKERYCRVNTRRGVELYRQLSESRCRYGKTWGYDRRGIWVDKGCRAEFLIRG